MVSVYNNLTEIALSSRKIELIEKYNKIVQYGRMNPVWFIEEIFRIPLLDYQKAAIMGTWIAEEAVWVMSRGSGKSFLGGIYIAARSILYPYHTTYIMTGTGSQSKETFKKIEDIANHRIGTLQNSSDVLYNEVCTEQGSQLKFVHEKTSSRCKFYNGSIIQSLIGVEENIVGKRCDLTYYDEAGKISENYFSLTEPFTVVNQDFNLGKGLDSSILPLKVPHQHLYTSSAEDVNSHLYQKYKECAKSMMMGYRNRFCIDLNCEVPISPTMNGEKQPPLLTKNTVERAMEDNPYKALREYYNIFDTNGGTDCIVGAEVFRNNEEVYLPIFSNELPYNENRKIGLFYDPAMKLDNSFILVGEFTRTKEKGWAARIINGFNLLNYMSNGDKVPMRFTEQVDYLRRLMVAYNGHHAQDWENIHLFIDPGAGGQGSSIADVILEEFYDEDNMKHFGVIDLNDPYHKGLWDESKVTTPIQNVLDMLSASKYKNAMFDAAAVMLSQNLVTFPAAPSSSHKIELDGRQYPLTKEQLRALVEIDVMKEEFKLMRKTKTEAGNIKYELTAEKKKNGHDDRAYCLAALCYYLQELRRKDKYEITTNNSTFALLNKKNKPGPASVQGNQAFLKNSSWKSDNLPWSRR